MGQTCCKNSSTVLDKEIPKYDKDKEIPKYDKHKEIPKDLNCKEVEIFIPKVVSGRVIKVYDGDTITIAAYSENTGGKLYKYSVRILGIDTPEIRTKNKTEKEVAKIARDKLAMMIYNNMIRLENISFDKYGRLLAYVIYEDIYINEWLIEKRLAVLYDGGTKVSPKCWMKYYKNEE
jgi:micrococcal nuclease